MPVESMAVGRNANGKLQVFAGADCSGTVYTCRQVPGGDVWEPWQALPAKGMTQCAVGQNADGRLEVFMLRGNGKWALSGTCVHLWQKQANGDFTGGQEIGAVGWEQIAMGRNPDGRLELFALVAGNIYHLWQTAPNGGWSAAAPFGTVGVTQMAVANKADGRFEVFALVGGDIWHFWQTEQGGWSNSEPFGTVGVTQMAVGSNADGRLEVFALVGGNIWHFWETGPRRWSNSEPFGTIAVTQMAIASNADGRLEVFALAGGELWHFWQTKKNNGWSHSLQFWDPQPPPSVYLTANPDSIEEGQSASLHWESGNAAALTIEPDVGPVAATGTVKVSPSWSTEYRLTGTLGSCEATSTATVTVEQKPVERPKRVGALLFYNCSPQRHTLHIWVFDATAGTGWREEGSIAHQWDDGSCPRIGAQPLRLHLEDGHVYRIVAVDPDALTCGGRNDPTIVGCQRWTLDVVGSSGGVEVPVTL